MKIITFKPFAFLLKNSVSNFSSSILEVINKHLALFKTLIVTPDSQQKSIGLLTYKNPYFTLFSKISQYILVGKDKSVVTQDNLCGPTSHIESTSVND